MKKATLVFVFFAGLIVALFWANFQDVPGYMDAEYYYVNALQLFRKEGLQEPFIWNYLSDPAGVPTPAFSYWMPLPSLLAAAGLFIFSNESFLAARSLFLICAGLLPVMVIILTLKLVKNNEFVWMAGILAIFCGYYTIFISQTDSFILLMILACCFYIAAFTDSFFSEHLWKWTLGFLTLGLLSGLIHLTRADGLLWLGVSAIILVWRVKRGKQEVSSNSDKSNKIKFILGAAVILAGYLCVTGWWYARNLLVWGTLMPPGGVNTIWLTAYDQMFVYPANNLSFQNWVASGWNSIINVRLNSFLQNLKTLMGVQLMIFLLPFVCAGAWKLRKLPIIRLPFFVWLGIFGVMTLVFPFAGARGGYFHSGSAIQPLIWALFPIGFQSFIDFGVKKRNWNAKVAGKVFAMGFMLIAIVLSGVLFFARVSGFNGTNTWDYSHQQYMRIANILNELDIDYSETIMVNNPPGFYLASGRTSIVIPDGDVSTLIKAARKYNANYLVLEPNHPAGLNDVFLFPNNYPDLVYLQRIDSAIIFRLTEK